MKVLITLREKSILEDYLNFCPLINEERDNVKKIDINTLSIDSYIDDGELEEIIIDNMLDCVPITQTLNILNKLIKKVKHGGTIIINGIDAYLVAKAFVEMKISIEEFNVLLHGTDREIQRTLGLTCSGVSNFLSESGLKIIHRRIDSFQYSVKAARP